VNDVRRDLAVITGFAMTAAAGTLAMSRRSALFALFSTWLLMPCAFAVWAIVPARFGTGYYRVQRFERARVYERCGVAWFRLFIRVAGLDWMASAIRNGPRAQARTLLLVGTANAETAHVVMFAVLLVVSAVYVSRGWWDTALWQLGFNVLFNVYPVLSLRHARIKGARFLKRER
jgi:hypothetical protein